LSTLRPKIFTTLKGYTLEQFTRDLVAGLIVAVVALPLSIALGIASGVSPEKGIHTAIIAGFLISLLGGSRVQIGGPTGAFMVIVYGIVLEFGIDGLMMATIMAGMILVLMGLFRMGGIIKFIPYPITRGFTTGIGLVIFTSQINDFLGLNLKEMPADFIGKWQMILANIDAVNGTTVLVGGLSLGIMILWPRVSKKIPGALVAIVVASVGVEILGLGVETIGDRFGEISSALPVFSLPAFDWSTFSVLLPPALTIAVLGAVESLLSAVVADGMLGTRHRSNMELVAQGVANMASGAFGGIPATGAIARTVTNINNGGRTPVAGMVHALALVVILVFFMPLAKLIPLTSLAAVLFLVAYNMSALSEMVALFKSPRSDILILWVTFVLTVVVDLIKAIEVGMILSSLLFMKRMAETTDIRLLTADAGEEDEEVPGEVEGFQSTREIQIYQINGPLFFGAADRFIDVLGKVHQNARVIVLRMRYVNSMDITAAMALKRFMDISDRRGIQLVISGIQPQPLEVLEKTGLSDRIQEDRIFSQIEDALVCAQKIVAENKTG